MRICSFFCIFGRFFQADCTMKITLAKPLVFQGQGRRDYQQDRYKISEDGRYFIVCDGMGGHGNGDLAAQTVCNALSVYFDTKPPENFKISPEYFDRAIMFAYDQLDKYDPHPDSIINMGTTMTCVYFGDNGALVAHCGDSRIYQIRPKYYISANYKTSVIIETKDHSLVQRLVDEGKITKEEAKKHPQRNVITKCMVANSDRDMAEYNSKSVIEGDYFFLCTDGILENVNTEKLCSILAMKISDDEKNDKLFSCCNNKTADNFTAMLLHVTEGYLPPLDLAPSATDVPQPTPIPDKPKEPNSLINEINEFLKKIKKR